MTKEPSTTGCREPLSAEAAFVVHLTSGRTDEPENLHGRVEHVRSGESRRFGSLADLVSFMRLITDREIRVTSAVAVLLAVLGSLSLAITAHAQVTSLPINKCLAGKIQGTGRSVAARTACLSKAANRGVADPGCLQKASDKLKLVFDKLEAKDPPLGLTPCLSFGDRDNLEGDISSFADGVVAATGSAPGKCDAAKIACTGRYVAAVASCAAKAARSRRGSGTIDGKCIANALAKLAGGSRSCLNKAALRTDCSTAGSQAASLQAAADAFLEGAICDFAPGSTGCTAPSPTPTNTSLVTPTPTPTDTPTPTPTGGAAPKLTQPPV